MAISAVYTTTQIFVKMWILISQVLFGGMENAALFVFVYFEDSKKRKI